MLREFKERKKTLKDSTNLIKKDSDKAEKKKVVAAVRTTTTKPAGATTKLPTNIKKESKVDLKASSSSNETLSSQSSTSSKRMIMNDKSLLNIELESQREQLEELERVNKKLLAAKQDLIQRVLELETQVLQNRNEFDLKLKLKEDIINGLESVVDSLRKELKSIHPNTSEPTDKSQELEDAYELINVYEQKLYVADEREDRLKGDLREAQVIMEYQLKLIGENEEIASALDEALQENEKLTLVLEEKEANLERLNVVKTELHQMKTKLHSVEAVWNAKVSDIQVLLEEKEEELNEALKANSALNEDLESCYKAAELLESRYDQDAAEINSLKQQLVDKDLEKMDIENERIALRDALVEALEENEKMATRLQNADSARDFTAVETQTDLNLDLLNQTLADAMKALKLSNLANSVLKQTQENEKSAKDQEIKKILEDKKVLEQVINEMKALEERLVQGLETMGKRCKELQRELDECRKQ